MLVRCWSSVSSGQDALRAPCEGGRWDRAAGAGRAGCADRSGLENQNRAHSLLPSQAKLRSCFSRWPAAGVPLPPFSLPQPRWEGLGSARPSAAQSCPRLPPLAPGTHRAAGAVGRRDPAAASSRSPWCGPRRAPRSTAHGSPGPAAPPPAPPQPRPGGWRSPTGPDFGRASPRREEQRGVGVSAV